MNVPNKTQNISFMKAYLQYALEFEKYVYIWQNALNEANDQMRNIYSLRKKIEGEQASIIDALETLDARYSRMREEKDRAAARSKKRSRVAFSILIVVVIICLALGCVLFATGLAQEGENRRNTIILFVLSVLGAAVLFICTLIGPICLGIYISNKSKYKQFQNEAENMGNSRERQEIILKEKKARADNDFVVSAAEESVLSKRQDEIYKSLQAAKNTLGQIYSKNVLPQKYRHLTAVATLYEYLETGRCNNINGHGGIYDTYVTDLQQSIIIDNLENINATLNRIEANQHLLYQELQQANKTLSSISSSLTEIEKSNAEIAQNTAISAVANQQTAAAARWMAWNAWARGY